jgi:hypothetical protein
VRWRTAVGVVLATGSLSVLPTSWASAAPTPPVNGPGTVGIRLVPLPGATSSNPLAHSYIVAQLAPGAALTRTVQIDNDTDHFAELSLYVAAASVVRGAFVFAPGTTANELSSWTTTSSRLVGLAAHTEVFDTVTTSVPSNASAGDQYAVVWVAMTASPTNGHGITMVSRAGVRMYISIGPGGPPPSNFVLGTLIARRSASGLSVVTTKVRNSGGGTLDLVGALTLSKGPGGLHAGPFKARLGVVLSPGSTESASVTLGAGFPRGPWRADLEVKSGFLARSSTATISFPSRHASPRGATAAGPLVPLVVALLSALTIGVLGLTFLRRPRFHRLLAHR